MPPTRRNRTSVERPTNLIDCRRTRKMPNLLKAAPVEFKQETQKHRKKLTIYHKSLNFKEAFVKATASQPGRLQLRIEELAKMKR